MKLRMIALCALILSNGAYSIKVGEAINNIGGSIETGSGTIKEGIKDGADTLAGNLKETGLKGAEKVSSTAFQIFGLGFVWNGLCSAKSWVWPSRYDKVVKMQTDEQFDSISSKRNLKQCLRLNKLATRDQRGWPIACDSIVQDFAMEYGRKEAYEMVATYNEFFPQYKPELS